VRAEASASFGSFKAVTLAKTGLGAHSRLQSCRVSVVQAGLELRKAHVERQKS
jgi:hypothetical protein